MAYRLVIKEEANLDIIKAYFYYESKRVGLGETFVQTLQSFFERIRNSPELFPKKNKFFREASITIFPYLIIYRFEKDSVYILSVFNTWQDPKRKP